MFSQLFPGSNYLLLEEGTEKLYPSHEHSPRWRHRLWYGLQAAFLIANIGIFASTFFLHGGPSVSECSAQISEYSPAIGTVTELKEGYFDGAFDTKNIYKGTPSDELNEAWRNISQIVYFPLTESEIRNVGKDPRKAVKFPPEISDSSEPYMAFLEVHHHLHCLNVVRKYVYSDYYTDDESFAYVTLDHIDHCIDMIRQQIMCSADVGIVTLSWVTFMDHATPDFSTKHKCRNFDAIRNWAQDKHIPFDTIPKPEGVIESETYPSENVTVWP